MNVPRIPHLRAACAAAALLALCGAPARAQQCGTRSTPAPTLRAGQTVRGSLERADLTLAGDRFDGTNLCTGRPYDSYFYEAQAGERITLVLESREIDPALTATTRWRGGGTKDVVEQRGSRGRSLTATGTVPAAGRILIQVESNVSLGRPGSTGGYSLTLRSERGGGAQPRETAPGRTPAIQAGRPVQGELTARSPRLSDESHYADYVYTARSGERIVVTLTSSDFDTYLHVGRAGSGTDLENATTDDDAAGGTNSRVEYVADRAGSVVVRANSLDKNETGRFTLQIQSGGASPDNPRPAPPAPTGTTLRLGSAVQGTLAAGDRQISDGSFYDDFTYMARRGERIVVRVTSDDFDTVLGVGQPTSDGGASDMVTDDDSGGGTNSRAEYTASRDGLVTIRVNALSRGDSGRYTVVVAAR